MPSRWLKCVMFLSPAVLIEPLLKQGGSLVLRLLTTSGGTGQDVEIPSPEHKSMLLAYMQFCVHIFRQRYEGLGKLWKSINRKVLTSNHKRENDLSGSTSRRNNCALSRKRSCLGKRAH